MPPSGSETSRLRGISQPETLTSDPSPTCASPIFAATPSTISSPELAAGLTPYDLPAGPTTDPSGPARVPASRSRRLANGKVSMTSGTSGLSGIDSSPSGALQSSLESSLRKQLTGSDLCEVTWKPWVTPWGQCRSRPRARVRTNLATDFGLWPRPTSLSYAGSHQPGNSRNMNAIRAHALAMLGEITSGVAGVMAKSGALTPALICSLMEYPTEWESCAPSGTLLRHRSQEPSSKRARKR